MYGLESFMSEASRRFGIETSEEALREAKDITEQTWRNWQIVSTPTTNWNTMLFTHGVPINTTIQPLTYAYPAQTSAFVLKDEVVLTFRPGSTAPQSGQVTCFVTNPDGATARSVGGAAADGAVAVRFPTDFSPELDLTAGTYQSEWYDVPAEPGHEANLLGNGSFEVEEVGSGGD